MHPNHGRAGQDIRRIFSATDNFGAFRSAGAQKGGEVILPAEFG
jgi:hypothetical protein